VLKNFGIKIINSILSDAWCIDVANFNPAFRWCVDTVYSPHTR